MTRNLNDRVGLGGPSAYAMFVEILILDSTAAYRDFIFMRSDGGCKVVLLINLVGRTNFFSVDNEFVCAHREGGWQFVTQRRVGGLNPWADAASALRGAAARFECSRRTPAI